MLNHKFRRHPANRIAKKGKWLGKLYAALDLGGVISDIIADPITPIATRIVRYFPRCASDTRMPLISVIVATRNNEKTLAASLNSILSQTYRNIEVIVINDASEDLSQQIIEEFCSRDERITVVTNQKRLGTGRSRNIGMQLARGEFITFQDGDDRSEAIRIHLQAQLLTKNPTKMICLCNYVRVDEKDVALVINNRRVMKCIISMMFRREEVLGRVGYFNDFSVGEDSDFYERIKIAFGKDSELLLFRTLYRALFRSNSSFFSEVLITSVTQSRVTYKPTQALDITNNKLRDSHEKIREGKLSVRVDQSK